MPFTADFETTTDKQDCRVWAYALYDIDSGYFECGNSLDDYMRRCREMENTVQYFHNLEFDGKFILDWLFRNGFEWIHEKKNKRTKTFTTLISDMGKFYSIVIYFSVQGKRVSKVTLYDSLKILPFSVADIATAFDLEISKLEIDYDEYRPVGHELTYEEICYIKNDVAIVGQALKVLFSEGLTKITQGANAMGYFKQQFGKKRFDNTFPKPYYDNVLRPAYKGGFTYVNPRYQEMELGEGIVLDVNSLYPSVMYECDMPYGEGKSFEGRYEKDEDYPLYVQMVKCQFELKPKHIPTIQIKGSWRFADNEYLTTSGEEEITLYLTSVDLALFLDHYDVFNIEWLGGWKFRASNTLFRAYIDHWNEIKMQATISGNKPMRTLAKLMLNAFYGKFGTNPKTGYKEPYYDGERVRYQKHDEEREPVYLPVALFVTAWARNKTIRSAQAVYDRFVYADTDSLHLLGTDLPEGLLIDPVKLGAWKHESTFRRAKFIRQKTYMEDTIIGREKAIKEITKLREEGKDYHLIDPEGYELEIKCAGLPKACYQYVTWENFQAGVQYEGKLKPTVVSGGVVLEETFFTMKG